MPSTLSPARITLLRALEAGAELRTDTSFGYPTWARLTNCTLLPPRQQAVKAAHDDGHLVLVRHEVTEERIAVGEAAYPIRHPVWTISDTGRAALAQATTAAPTRA